MLFEQSDEHAALVALLQARPEGLSWPEIAAELGTVIPDDAAVSVVGSRGASPAGLAMAADIARALSARKLTVIAGLARGIDTVAHRAALDAGGRTVAVIGTGIGFAPPVTGGARLTPWRTTDLF
jgi:DNA processing protein